MSTKIKGASPINLFHGLSEFLTVSISPQSLANSQKLWLNVFTVKDPKLWPDGPIYECNDRIRCPLCIRQTKFSHGFADDCISLVCIGTDDNVRREYLLVVDLIRTLDSSIIVWAYRRQSFLNMWAN